MTGCVRLSSGTRGRGGLPQGLGGLGQPLEQRRRQVEVVDLGDVLAPAVQEVAPAVVQLEAARTGLVPGLAQEPEVATVVEVPDQGPDREAGSAAERRPGHVLAHTGGVDDQRAGGQPGEQLVGVLGARDPDQLHPSCSEPGADVAERRQARGVLVGDHDPGGRGPGGEQPHGDGRPGPSGSQAQHVGPVQPATGAKEVLDGQARGDGVLGVAEQTPATPGDAGDLLAQAGVPVQLVEQPPGVAEHVQLVAGDEGAGDAGVVGQPPHHVPVDGGLRPQPDVPSLDPGVQAQDLRPPGEQPHDARAAGVHPDEHQAAPTGLRPRMCHPVRTYRADGVGVKSSPGLVARQTATSAPLLGQSRHGVVPGGMWRSSR
jgi:hypothetical protein